MKLDDSAILVWCQRPRGLLEAILRAKEADSTIGKETILKSNSLKGQVDETAKKLPPSTSFISAPHLKWASPHQLKQWTLPHGLAHRPP